MAEKTTAKPAKKAAKKAPTPRKRTARAASPSYEQIAERAYFIAQENGDGDDVDNWLRAERELTAA